MSKPQIIFMPHANIQYSQLAPERRAWVCENCYRPLFELVRDNNYRIAFEASGRTLEVMAEEAPAVLALLKDLCQNGQIEPIGSPFIHVMLANIPQEVGLAALKHGLDAWEKYTGIRPVTGWNPECGWAGYLPDLFVEAGYKNLVMDADSFFLSYPQIRHATGLAYDVQGHSNKNALFKIEDFIADKPEFLKYLTNPSVAPNGLKLVMRSDCMANPMLWYLMGATEGQREQPIQLSEIREMLTKWQTRIADTGKFIMPYAEDAEYIGSSAYFYVTQFNQARFFEPEPGSIKRFKELLDTAIELGYDFATPSQVINEAAQLIPNPDIDMAAPPRPGPTPHIPGFWIRSAGISSMESWRCKSGSATPRNCRPHWRQSPAPTSPMPAGHHCRLPPDASMSARRSMISRRPMHCWAAPWTRPASAPNAHCTPRR